MATGLRHRNSGPSARFLADADFVGSSMCVSCSDVRELLRLSNHGRALCRPARRMDPRWAGKERELNRQMRDMALESNGILSLDSLATLGMSKGMIHTRATSGRLIPVLRGVYTLPGTRLTLRGGCRAAAASAGPLVAVSHESALALHGLVRDP